MRRAPSDRPPRFALALLLGLSCLASTGCTVLKKTYTAELWTEPQERNDPNLYFTAALMTPIALVTDVFFVVGSVGEMAEEAGAIDALADYNKEQQRRQEIEAVRQRAYQAAYVEALSEQAGETRANAHHARAEREAAREKRDADRRRALEVQKNEHQGELKRNRARRTAERNQRERDRLERERRQEEERERVINARLAELGEGPIEKKKAHQCTVLDDYISVVETKWGEKCGSDDSFSVIVRNDGSHKIEVELCLEQKNGKWDCGSSTTKPAKNLGMYTCHATGNYVFRGRAREDWGRGCTPNDPNTKRPLPLATNRIRGS